VLTTRLHRLIEERNREEGGIKKGGGKRNHPSYLQFFLQDRPTPDAFLLHRGERKEEKRGREKGEGGGRRLTFLLHGPVYPLWRCTRWSALPISQGRGGGGGGGGRNNTGEVGEGGKEEGGGKKKKKEEKERRREETNTQKEERE